MTKEEFVTLQSELQQSGRTIKSYLQEKGVHYSTYHYWCNKFSGDTATDKLAPIRGNRDGSPIRLAERIGEPSQFPFGHPAMRGDTAVPERAESALRQWHRESAERVVGQKP